MPPRKDKKRYEVHFTETIGKEFEKIAKKGKGNESHSTKHLMETILLEWLEKKKKETSLKVNLIKKPL